MQKWDLKKLFIPPLIVTFLIWSWLSPSIRPLWDHIDRNTFHFLNSWIKHNPIWQNFWAFAGHPIMDWIHDLFMLLFFYFHIRFAKTLKRRKVAEFLFSFLLIALVIWIIQSTSFFYFYRKSPTLVESTAFRLSHVIDWTHVKDVSKKSFPSDHAITALLFVSLVFNFMDAKKRGLAVIYSIFFCLPRLVAGAHWLTDVLIGSGSIVLLVISLTLGTPFASWIVNALEKGIQKMLFQFKRSISSE